MLNHLLEELVETYDGVRLEAVTCERCSTSFYYALNRQGVGKSSAFLFHALASDRQRASTAAQRDLDRQLDQAADLVPCPHCHWVNAGLIARYRQQQCRRIVSAIVIAFLVLLFGGTIASVFLSEHVDYRSRLPAIVSLSTLLLAFTSPGWMLVGRRLLRERINPNRTFPGLPVIPPGTPPALIKQTDRQTGEQCLVAVPRDEPAENSDIDWAIFRPGQFVLPLACCVCIGAATTYYRSPFQTAKNNEIAVPLCETCQAGRKRKWRLGLLVGASTAIVSSGLLAILLPGADTRGRWAIFVIFAFFGSLVGSMTTASRWAQPYRIAIVDRQRGVFRFAAENPAYTAMMKHQVAIADGVA